MAEMVDARRSAETKEERRDLFSGLLGAAGDDTDGGVAITNQELIRVVMFQLPCRVTFMKRVPTRHPRQYVHLPPRWTRGIVVPSSTVDDSPYTLLHVRPIGTFSRRARALISGNQGYNGRPEQDFCTVHQIKSHAHGRTDLFQTYEDMNRFKRSMV